MSLKQNEERPFKSFKRLTWSFPVSATQSYRQKFIDLNQHRDFLSEKKIQEIKSRAKEFNSTSSLISRGLITYCMANKQIINPRSESFHLTYGCIGADLLTPLLMTDATKIIGVDMQSFSKEKFIELLNKKMFEYTNYFSDIFEALLVVELLNLPASSIEVSEKSIDEYDAVVINFDWAYPGDKPKRRELILIKSDFLDFVKQIKKNQLGDAVLVRCGCQDENNYVNGNMQLSNLIGLKSKHNGWFLRGWLNEDNEDSLSSHSVHFGASREYKSPNLVSINVNPYGHKIQLLRK